MKTNRLFDNPNVSRPSHYCVTLPDGNTVECLEIMEALGMTNDHHVASAFAYLWRADKKEDGAKYKQDLEKAAEFLLRKVSLLQGEKEEADEWTKYICTKCECVALVHDKSWIDFPFVCDKCRGGYQKRRGM